MKFRKATITTVVMYAAHEFNPFEMDMEDIIYEMDNGGMLGTRNINIEEVADPAQLELELGGDGSFFEICDGSCD